MEMCFSKVTKSLGSGSGAAFALAGLGPGWLSTTQHFSQINQEASQCQESWDFFFSSHLERCLEAEMGSRAGQRSFKGRSSLPLSVLSMVL